MEILKLYPVCKNYIWGGSKLPEKYGKSAEVLPVAESWELSFHPDGPTRVEDGRALQDVLTKEMWGSNCAKFPAFPMLIKLIDAKENLSVQVHPSDDYALVHENSFGKTEAWYIVEAEEGAGIYLGFKRDTSEAECRAAIENGTLCELLNFYRVRAGECYFIPSGTIHAIGAGCLICEIQQNSNLTYRVFDYDRRDKNGNKRELHVEKALRVIDYKKYEKSSPSKGLVGEECLASCSYFHASRINVAGEGRIATDTASFKCLICVSGEGSIGGQSAVRGESFFLPAQNAEICLQGDMELICAEVRA